MLAWYCHWFNELYAGDGCTLSATWPCKGFVLFSFWPGPPFLCWTRFYVLARSLSSSLCVRTVCHGRFYSSARGLPGCRPVTKRRIIFARGFSPCYYHLNALWTALVRIAHVLVYLAISPAHCPEFADRTMLKIRTNHLGEGNWPTTTTPCKKHVSSPSSHVHCNVWPNGNTCFTRIDNSKPFCSAVRTAHLSHVHLS